MKLSNTLFTKVRIELAKGHPFCDEKTTELDQRSLQQCVRLRHREWRVGQEWIIGGHTSNQLL